MEIQLYPNRYLIKPKKLSSIVQMESALELTREGTVVKSYEGALYEVGAEVVYESEAGAKAVIAGSDYLIIKSSDIHGEITKPNNI